MVALGPSGEDGPHCFVTDVDSPELEPGDLHHLQRVLRLGPGDSLTVSDGCGRWRRCRFAPMPEPAGEVHELARPTPRLSVGFALVKGQKPELVVQKLTEAGVDVIAPFVAERSVTRWDEDKADRHHDRFERIAREAAMQCRRVHLPTIRRVQPFAALCGPGVVRADRSGRPLRGGDHTVMVGPEGGWSDGERDLLPEAVVLGPTVLRAETAAIAAGLLLVALRGGFVGESSRRAGRTAQ